MLQFQNANNKKNLQKKYVIDGARIFDSIGNFFARMFSSNVTKQSASAALQAGKTAAKDIGMKPIDVCITVVIDAGNKLVEKAAKKLSSPKSQVTNVIYICLCTIKIAVANYTEIIRQKKYNT